MQIVVLSDEGSKEELLRNGFSGEVRLDWVSDLSGFSAYPRADVFMDLLFENDEERIIVLRKLLPATVIINSVAHTLPQTDPFFVRINAWPTFLSSGTIEAAAEEDRRPRAESALGYFHKKIEWLPDQPGFITARVVSMIINEAFLAFGEGVSTKEEIDTAMKLGTNYPYGPFEWAERIGKENISSLLTALNK
jgi:3-hydroxybutyryl-CoA dehydrogenase